MSIDISETIDRTQRASFKVALGKAVDDEVKEAEIHITKVNDTFQFTHKKITNISDIIDNDIFANLFSFSMSQKQRMDSATALKIAETIIAMCEVKG